MSQICLWNQTYEFCHIDRCWTSNVCPFDYKNICIGDIIFYSDAQCDGINTYTCKVLKKEYIQSFDTIDILVDVLDIKKEKNKIEFMHNYENKYSI